MSSSRNNHISTSAWTEKSVLLSVVALILKWFHCFRQVYCVILLFRSGRDRGWQSSGKEGSREREWLCCKRVCVECVEREEEETKSMDFGGENLFQWSRRRREGRILLHGWNNDVWEAWGTRHRDINSMKKRWISVRVRGKKCHRSMSFSRD